MAREEILVRLSQVVADTLGLSSVSLTSETVAGDIEGWDSMGHIRVILAVEKEFGIKFAMAEIGELENIGELADQVDQKTNR